MNSSSNCVSYMKNSCKDLQVEQKQRQLYAQLTKQSCPLLIQCPVIWEDLTIVHYKRLKKNLPDYRERQQDGSVGKVPAVKSEGWNSAPETVTVEKRTNSYKLLSDLHRFLVMDRT